MKFLQRDNRRPNTLKTTLQTTLKMEIKRHILYRKRETDGSSKIETKNFQTYTTRVSPNGHTYTHKTNPKRLKESRHQNIESNKNLTRVVNKEVYKEGGTRVNKTKKTLG